MRSAFVLAILAVTIAGCGVQRSLTVKTDPPGALVYLNGLEVGRIAPAPASLRPSIDDPRALADAVREAARPQPVEWGRINEVGRRGHLRVLRDPDA